MRLPWEIPALAFAAIVAASCSSLAVLPAPSLCPAPKAYTAAEEARAARAALAPFRDCSEKRALDEVIDFCLERGF